jgi:glycosyltransferase involved in cell wall biosynthesis
MSYALVIPCYNEELRLPKADVLEFIGLNPEFHILFVNDGSTDRTWEVLKTLANLSSRITSIELSNNFGKAEAVRQGLLKVRAEGHAYIGFADADFATPPTEVARLFQIAEQSGIEAVLGSRVMMLGVRIVRRPLRHYLGRIFATFASIALKLPVYDTQCGAKVFRNTSLFEKSIDKSFLSKWAFDVELIARLSQDRTERIHEIFLEVPLREWRDVSGTKLRMAHMLGAFVDLWRISKLVRSMTPRR